MINFLLPAGLSLGASALVNLFGRPQKQWTLTEVNKQDLDRFSAPSSQYGDPIPDAWGRVKLKGTYAGAQLPPDYETDESRNPVTREVVQTSIYFGNACLLWCRKPETGNNPTIERIYLDKRIYYENGQIDSTLGQYWGRFEGLTLNNYYGDQTEPDNYLGFMGANKTAHHGKVISVLHRLRLNGAKESTPFNFGYPDAECIFNTHPGTSPTLAEIIDDLLDKAGYLPDEYDTSELDAIAVRGFQATIAATSEKLAALQWAYNFECVDTGSDLKFITQYRPSVSAVIPLSDLAAREDGEGRSTLFTETEENEVSKLPTIVRVAFTDYLKDFQRNTKDSFRANDGPENIQDVDLTGLTLTETEALTIANRILQLAWLRRKALKFSLLPRYCGLEAGDVVQVPLRGTPELFQIRRINQAANGLIQVEAYPYDPEIYDLAYFSPAANTIASTATQGTPIATGQTNLYAVNSVTNASGSVTFSAGTDYTVNLTTGAITPTIGGAIANGTQVKINFQGQEQPIAQPPPPALPPDPSASLPRVIAFSPTQGKVGDAIAIYGSNFTGATEAAIGGNAIASLTVVDDSKIVGAIAASTTSGVITVTNADGEGESLGAFTIVDVLTDIEWADIGGDPYGQQLLKLQFWI